MKYRNNNERVVEEREREDRMKGKETRVKREEEVRETRRW